VAGTAALGGIVISPEAYQPTELSVRLRSDLRSATDFRDSEVDLSSLALDTAIDGVDILLA
jgi:hypothetical protein